MNMILFIGDRPSKHNKDPKVAFVGTKSHKTLLKWIEYLGLKPEQCVLINRTDPSFEFMIEFFLADSKNRIIPLGKKAAIATLHLWIEKAPNILDYGTNHLDGLKLSLKAPISKAPIYCLPHPSGLNRKLNDKAYLKQQLDSCKDFINSP